MLGQENATPERACLRMNRVVMRSMLPGRMPQLQHQRPPAPVITCAHAGNAQRPSAEAPSKAKAAACTHPCAAKAWDAKHEACRWCMARAH